MLIAIWHMLQSGETYSDPGKDFYLHRTAKARHGERSINCEASATRSP